MGTPTHTYCSLRDLLKNNPSPTPKFKNHSCLRTKPELEDVYTNISLDVSVLESLSPSKKPSYQIANGVNGKGKVRAIGKPQMVEFSSIGSISNGEKSKPSFVEEKISTDPQDVMFASDEDEPLKPNFANGEKEDGAEKTEMEKNGAVESEDEVEENAVVESEKENGKENGVIKSEEY